MKRLFIILTLLMPLPVLTAQDVKVVTDEECGCDLIYVDGIQTTRSDELYGFRREDGTVIAPNIYRYVGVFTDGYCKVFLDDGQCGLIDRDGREVVPCTYDDVNYPSEGRIVVIKNGYRGYTDLDGNVVIPPQFLMAGPFGEGSAPVKVLIDSTHSGFSFIDPLGNVLFPPVYENVQPFTYGLAEVMLNQRWGIMDRKGQMVLPAEYEQMTTFFDSLFFAGNLDGMALFDMNMKPLTPFVYTWTGGMQDGRIPVQHQNGKYGFLDRQGREVIPCIYDEISLFGSGRAMVGLNNRYGIVDTTGRLVLPIEYESTTPKGERYVYRDDRALVEKGGKMGYVDLDGNLVIPLYFEEAYQFSEGLASVRFNGMWGYIDTKGDIFMPFIFDIASPYRWGRAEVYYNGALRNVDRHGRCVKNCNGIIAWRDWTE